MRYDVIMSFPSFFRTSFPLTSIERAQSFQGLPTADETNHSPLIPKPHLTQMQEFNYYKEIHTMHHQATGQTGL